MSIVIDASVWVAAAIPDQEHHLQTMAWLATLADDTLVTPTLGLVETAGAVSRRTGSAALARRTVAAIEALPNVIVVLPDPGLWLAAIAAAAERRLRGADAVYVATADALGFPLATWDGEQAARAGRRVRVMTPASS